MFANQIGRNMEVYVDDMLVKSLQMQKHIEDLEEAFGVLRKYNMKLNPDKCVFGVTSGKFLSFVIHHRGIEANPDKIKVVLELQAPTTIKQLQRLNDMIAAMSRFTISG